MISVVGRGSQSKVLLVKRKDNSKLYALKVCKKDKVTHCFKEAIFAQRSALIALSSPFIVKLYTTFQNHNKLFFVLEYCPGGELFHLLQRMKVFPEKVVKFYAVQLVEALSCIHRAGLIYRDLKLENIVIDRQGYLRIIDFGLTTEALPASAVVCKHFTGSVPSLPPEAFEQKYSTAADFWALGVVLFELVSGTSPFIGSTPAQTVTNIRQKEPSLPTDISGELKEVISCCLSKDPLLRPKDTTALAGMGWFQGVNWQAIKQKEAAAPFVPQLKHPFDVSCFDKSFTEESFSPLQSFVGQRFSDFQYDKSSQSSGAVSPPSPPRSDEDDPKKAGQEDPFAEDEEFEFSQE